MNFYGLTIEAVMLLLSMVVLTIILIVMYGYLLYGAYIMVREIVRFLWRRQ